LSIKMVFFVKNRAAKSLNPLAGERTQVHRLTTETPTATSG
jgi:hypothetical protein